MSVKRPRGVVLRDLTGWRLLRALTQTELRAQAHIARVTIQRAERGENINVSSARKIATALDMSLDALRWNEAPTTPDVPATTPTTPTT